MQQELKRHPRIGRWSFSVVMAGEELQFRLLLGGIDQPVVLLRDIWRSKPGIRHGGFHRIAMTRPTLPVVIECPALLRSWIVIHVRLVADLKRNQPLAKRACDILRLFRRILRCSMP